MQETFLKALRGFDSFEPGSNFKAWIFRILRNTYLTSRSGLHAQRTVSLEESCRNKMSPVPPVYPEAAIDRATPEINLSASHRSCRTCTARWKTPAAAARSHPAVRRGRDEVQGDRRRSRYSHRHRHVPHRTRARRICANLLEPDTPAATGSPAHDRPSFLHHAQLSRRSANSPPTRPRRQRSISIAAPPAPLARSPGAAENGVARAGQRYVAGTQLQERLRRLASGRMQRSGYAQQRSFIPLHQWPASVWAMAAMLLVIAGERDPSAAAYAKLRNRFPRRQPRSSMRCSDLHIATLAANQPPQVISSDRHTVKPWFQGKLPFSFNLPENLPDRYKARRGKPHLSAQPSGGAASLQHRPPSRICFSPPETGRRANAAPNGTFRLSCNRLRYR